MTSETELHQTIHQKSNQTNNCGKNNNNFGESQLAAHTPVKALHDDLSLHTSIDPSQRLEAGVQEVIQYLIESISSNSWHHNINGSSQSSISLTSTGVAATALTEPISKDSLVQDDDLDETHEVKDIVTLRNLEISPPPQPELQSLSSANEISVTRGEDEEQPDQGVSVDSVSDSSVSGRKRARSQASESSVVSEGRAKRQRTQTKLFQVGSTPNQPTRPSRSSAPSRPPISPLPKKSTTRTLLKKSSPQTSGLNLSNDLQDVIFYEKNDYLAIRNEENTFYICQLAENIRVVRPTVKVKWLDTSDNGETYFMTSHYDKVPQKSIIMPVILNKLKREKKSEQIFTLDDQVKDNIMERLKRSLSVSLPENNSSRDQGHTS